MNATDKENSPPVKKPRLSLSLRDRCKSSRFAMPLNEGEMAQVCEGYTPQNTKKNTDWAMRAFNDWRCQRGDNSGAEKRPSDLLENLSAEKINYSG